MDPAGPNVQFILFTRNNPFYNLKLNVHENFINSTFNFSNPTKIIIHGFLSSTKEDVFILHRDAFLGDGYYNVIGMDWSALCEFEYFTAMRGAQIAGEVLGVFLGYLIDEGVGYQNIHLIGHSLGAHVAAMGADKLKSKGVKVRRITGLDPAGPGYTDVPLNFRLDRNDAHLVDIIHTNMKVLSLPHPQGHIDFYPNGGKFQPGCPDMYDIWTLHDGVECNHGRAYYYFAESVKNKYAFKTFRCTSIENANVGNCSYETNVYMGQEETYEILDCARSRIKIDVTYKGNDFETAVRRCEALNISWYGLYYFRTKANSPYAMPLY